MIWVMGASAMVFFMQAGFCLLEAGMVRAKSVCNILMKNTMDFSVGALAFFFIGFGLMFGASSTGWFGTSLFALTNRPDTIHESWIYAYFVFQVVFAGTAATIISGAMAERTRFLGYLIYSSLICAIVYPMFGKWAWGGGLLGTGGTGWLQDKGFHDFAGSTVVHLIGGCAAFSGAIVVGPRLGKFMRDGRVIPIPGHNLPFAALGTFILFFGWFGFNGGSTLDGGDPAVAQIIMNTILAGASGGVASMATTWIAFGRPDTALTLNGILAGLVSITAGCNVIHPPMAIVTGTIAGALMVGSVMFLEYKLRLDDPVGAVSVHGVCGAWGTMALAIPGFSPMAGAGQLQIQALGIGIAFIWAFSTSVFIFYLLKSMKLLRVSKEQELMGLDILEHGNEGYPASAWALPSEFLEQNKRAPGEREPQPTGTVKAT